jgi:hypothetical protein
LCIIRSFVWSGCNVIKTVDALLRFCREDNLFITFQSYELIEAEWEAYESIEVKKEESSPKGRLFLLASQLS